MLLVKLRKFVHIKGVLRRSYNLPANFTLSLPSIRCIRTATKVLQQHSFVKLVSFYVKRINLCSNAGYLTSFTSNI